MTGLRTIPVGTTAQTSHPYYRDFLSALHQAYNLTHDTKSAVVNIYIDPFKEHYILQNDLTNASYMLEYFHIDPTFDLNIM